VAALGRELQLFDACNFTTTEEVEEAISAADGLFNRDLINLF
jgi:hypothetical protein